ncbi:uncharacterized protein LOC141898673 [Tubulanus polymorphus]|uniref:uncharacterized protein LOC141898673 n=1 Tax=Tubulanus polymorphus TaxID=672921 RepID=UPI003DA675CA
MAAVDPTEGPIMDAKSLSLKYKMLMNDKPAGTTGPVQERVSQIFKVLKELIPHMGIFSEIMKLMSDELFDAVFSHQLTMNSKLRQNSHQSQSSRPTQMDRVPYFTLVHRVFTQQDARAEDMMEKVEILKKKLFEKHKAFEDSVSKTTHLMNECEQLKEMISQLEEEVVDRNAEIDSLEEKMEEEHNKAEKLQKNLEAEIADLEERLEEAREEIRFLSTYKKGYDELQDAFTEKMIDDPPIKRKKPVVATRRAHLMSDIESARKIEEQLLAVQNSTLEEFEKFFEQGKEELSTINLNATLTATEFSKHQDVVLERADQELLLEQERFNKNIDELNTELGLIRQHTVMLEEQLQILEEHKPTLPSTMKNASKLKKKPVHPLAKELGGIDDDNPIDDPFVPQERIFSKYAAMMYTSSNGGHTYHEFKGAKYCASCGEKTVICPHKMGNAENVLPLPINCSHIKILRPKVKINLQMMDELFQPLTAASTVKPPSTQEAESLRPETMGETTGESASMQKRRSRSSTPSVSADSPATTLEAHMKYPPHKLWEDYAERTDLARTIPRPISLARSKSLIEQFSAFIIWQDEHGDSEEGYFSILENLYHFMLERYLKEDVMFLAMHDLLSSLLGNAGKNKFIQMFIHVLVGNYDAATYRYVLLLADLIDRVEWKQVNDFRLFCEVLYPFAVEDDFETLQMGYISFTRNKISKELVLEYLLYLILKYRELRLLECEGKLLLHPGKEPGQMTWKEFSDALDQLLPVTNEMLTKRLFWEAEAHIPTSTDDNAVPIQRLAQIASYLSILQLNYLVKDDIREKVEEARNRPNSAAAATAAVNNGKKKSDPQSQLAPDTDKLLTMSRIRSLAANISRRNHLREIRLTEDLQSRMTGDILRLSAGTERDSSVANDSGTAPPVITTE